MHMVAGKNSRFATLFHKVARYGARCSARCGARCGAHYGPRVGHCEPNRSQNGFFRVAVFTQSFTRENGPLQPSAGCFAGTITVTPKPATLVTAACQFWVDC